MKDSEKQEARYWLEGLTRLYEQHETVIRTITSLHLESPAQDWDKAFSNENVSILINAIQPVKELPKPKNKELRKLKECYTDLVAACLKAGHLYLNAYYAGELSRFRYSKMIYWSSFANKLLGKFSTDLAKVHQEIDV